MLEYIQQEQKVENFSFTDFYRFKYPHRFDYRFVSDFEPISIHLSVPKKFHRFGYRFFRISSVFIGYRLSVPVSSYSSNDFCPCYA